MRIAVSGSHSTGKSTLIAAFLDRCPGYLHEPEAFETLGDEVELTDAGEPTPDGLEALLRYTVSRLEGHERGSRVVFERSPADYLAYAAASRGGAWKVARRQFLAVQVPIVRRALERLDVIAYLPVSAAVEGRSGEDARYRRRVDESLRRALLDDEYDLFTGRGPIVRELPGRPGRQLAALLALADCAEPST